VLGYYVNSEYKPLKAVLLCRPPSGIGNIDSPRDVLHLARIDYAAIEREFEKMVAVYKKFKIKVFFIDSRKIKDTDERYVFNLMFTRDLFFMTLHGAILSRMFSEVRQDEVRYAEKALQKDSIRIRKSIQNNGTFEGADALWVNDRLVVVGVGKRTNAEGFRQIKEELKRDGVKCVCVPAPRDTLHLLGALQFVDSALCLVRVNLVDPEIINFLKRNRIKIIKIPENGEVRKKQAMNFLTVTPREIIMPADCPQTKRIYERAGIKVAAEIKVTQLVNGGGGLACATGVLARAMELAYS